MFIRTPRLRSLILAAILSGGAAAGPPVQAGPTPAPSDAPQPSPPPKPGPYRVVTQHSVSQRMRDGTELRAEVSLPDPLPDRVPAILIRTPYNKTRPGAINEPARDFFVSHGYAVVIQDIRGRYESAGEYAYLDNPTDGYDTADWLVAQPWSNGTFGTFGCSNPAELQFPLIARRHPGHQAAILMMSGGGAGSAAGLYAHDGDPTGVRRLAPEVDWYAKDGARLGPAPRDRGPAAAEAMRRYDTTPVLPKDDWKAVYAHLPARDALDVLQAPQSDYEAFGEHEPADPWWRGRGFLEDDDVNGVPALHVGSWFDYGAHQVPALYRWMGEHAATPEAHTQQLIMSASEHCGHTRLVSSHTVVGARDLGDMRYDFWAQYLAFFDHWLKGAPYDPGMATPVRYYMLGEDRWRTASSWPPAGETTLTLALAEGSGAPGALLARAGAAGEAALTYDPADPAPTLGGTNGRWQGDDGRAIGMQDQRPLFGRRDVLTFLGAPLTRPVKIAGQAMAELTVSSSAKDSDLVVKLLQALPDGRVFNVSSGVLRLRYREGVAHPKLMTPGATYRVRITLDDTAITFAPGERIGLLVTSSDFPAYTRNSNTGGDIFRETRFVTARNVIHTGGAAPSRLVLPVLP